MKKQDIAGIIVYVIILALAAVFGLVVIRQYASKSDMETGFFMLFIGGAIIAGIIFNSILYELAHMLGAKMGGYFITSVSVLGFTFEKIDGKVKFHFASFDGLTGETKIIPNIKRKKPSNPIPYSIMGTIFFLVEVIGVVLSFSLLTREGTSSQLNNIAYFLLVVMAVGAIIIFYNIIPFQLDSMTDGYRLRLVSGKKNKEAFNKMLLGETSISESEEVSVEETSFSSDLKLNQVLICLDKEQFVEAEQLVDSIIENAKTDKKVSHRAFNEAKAYKIFLVFVNNDIEEAKTLLEKELSLKDKKALSEEGDFSFLRAYLLVSSIIDRSRSECLRTLDKVYKAYKRAPDNRRSLEVKLFNRSLDIVIAKYPDWGLEDRKISENN